jgi:hypothetical protein
MTSVPTADTAAPMPHDPGAVWRATQKDLWVARRDGRHLGTVECGHRFLATDADGEPIGAFRTLDGAMSAVLEQCSRTARARPRREGSWGALAFVATISAAALAMLSAYGLLLL